MPILSAVSSSPTTSDALPLKPGSRCTAVPYERVSPAANVPAVAPGPRRTSRRAREPQKAAKAEPQIGSRAVERLSRTKGAMCKTRRPPPRRR